MINKKLFAFDLDGTLLGHKNEGKLSAKTVKKVKDLIEQGHKVCVLTGRP